MHNNSKLALKNKIKIIFEKINLNSKHQLSFDEDAYDHIEAILKELHKQKNKKTNFIYHLDIFTIIYNQLFTVIKTIPNSTLSNTLGNILDVPTIEELTNKTLDFLIQIPRTYSICFDIPLFKGDLLIQLENSSIYFSFEALVETNYLKSLMSIRPNNIHTIPSGLTCTAQGYCYNVKNDTFKQALSLLKIITQQGFFKKIFLKNINKKNAGYLPKSLSNEGKNIPLYYAHIKDELDGSTLKSELPDYVSCFLDKLKINSNHQFISNRLETELKKFFLSCNLIAYNEDRSVKSIKSAIEWTFDSYANEEYDNSMAFLQICFGLEALFTENEADAKEEKPSIISTLSIKCAYLIAKSIKERKLIVEKIKEIYRIRSNLVHGRQNSLTAQELNLFFYARNLLELSIDKEIEMNITLPN